MLKKVLFVIWGIIITFLLLSSKAQALTTIKTSGDSADVSIESNEIIDDNVMTAGNNIYIRGVINDDLFVAGSNIKIEGEIKGNLFAAGNSINITGKIDKDVFLGGNFISISDNATIGRDLFIGGNLIEIDGNIGRNISIGGSIINLNGKAIGNANISAQTLNLGENSQIQGNLDYQTEKEIAQDKNSHIAGEIKYNQPDTNNKQKNNYNLNLSSWLISLLQFLIIGILLVLIIPKWFNQIGETIQKQTLKSIGIGIIISIVAPILILIALITILGMPIAMIAGIIYVLLLAMARFWVAYCIGLWIGKNKFSPIITIIVGVLILQLIFLIPIISIIAKIIIMIIGLGAIYIVNPLKSAK